MKLRLLLCATLACATLAACNEPSAEWSAVEAPKALRVDYQRMTHEIGFAPGAAELAGGEHERLAAFLEAAEMTPDDHIYLEATVDDRLSSSRISALARDLSRNGYAVSSLPPGRDAMPPNHLLVVIERYIVTPPDCPNWTKSPTGNHENAQESNFGCATMTNFGLMVADPRDLVVGRALGPADANSASLAIQRYRNDQLKPLPTESSGSTFGAAASGSAVGGGPPAPGSGQ